MFFKFGAVALATTGAAAGLAVVAVGASAGSARATSAATGVVSAQPTVASGAGSGGAWYQSVWTRPIAAGVLVWTASTRWMDALHNNIAQINVNQDAWTPSVFLADRSTPRQKTMLLANDWRLDNVPIPASLKPSGDTDAYATIIDSSTGRAYDFFRLSKAADGSWQAYSGAPFRLGGSGWWDGTYKANGIKGPWAGHASGAALGAGLIRPEEVRAGVIPHALKGCAPKYLIGPPVSPARTSDGSGGAGAMPMGSLLQLDPSLDVSQLGLEPGEEMIARALQVYGMYIVESSSAFCIYAQNFSTLGSNPYPLSWSSGIRKDLIRRMRVVAPPPAPVYDNRSIFGQPYKIG